MNVGDHVKVNALYSAFNKQKGIITEVIDQTKEYTVFPYTVKFDDGTPQGDECYFAEDEILEDK
jgi:hypothetical protein